MFMPFFMLIGFIMSLVVPVAIVIGIVTYVKRTRQLQELESGGSHMAVLDSLDQVHIRLDAISERLARVEEHLDADDEEARRLRKPEEGEDVDGTGG